MKKIKHISINKPCSEDWHKMSPQAQGRFCERCAQSVVDFTDKTNEEIIAYLQQHSTHSAICGKLDQAQIKEINAQLRRDAPSFWLIPPKRWIAAVLGGLLLGVSGVSTSHSQSVTHMTEQAPAAQESFVDVLPTPRDKYINGRVKGVVYDKKTKSFVANVFVKVKGTDQGVFTDKNGTFVLTGVALGDKLEISRFGYKTKHVLLVKRYFSQPIRVNLKSKRHKYKSRRRRLLGRLHMVR